MANAREFTAERLDIARRAIEGGRYAAQPATGYVNFEVALAVLDGCRNSITMSDPHDPNTVIQKLETAKTSLELVQSGAAEASVKAARANLEEAITAWRLFDGPT
jgi:hypothetical protein